MQRQETKEQDQELSWKLKFSKKGGIIWETKKQTLKTMTDGIRLA